MWSALASTSTTRSPVAPAEVAARATSLSELAGRTFDRTLIICELVARLRDALSDAVAAPAEFGQRFGELCLQVDQTLTIDVAGRRTTGRCAGIAPDGGLLLETAAGLQKFYSGVLVH